MTREGLRAAALIAWGVGVILGLGVLFHEINYANSHPGTGLPGVIEVIGVAIAAVSVGGACTTMLAFMGRDAGQR